MWRELKRMSKGGRKSFRGDSSWWIDYWWEVRSIIVRRDRSCEWQFQGEIQRFLIEEKLKSGVGEWCHSPKKSLKALFGQNHGKSEIHSSQLRTSRRIKNQIASMTFKNVIILMTLLLKGPSLANASYYSFTPLVLPALENIYILEVLNFLNELWNLPQ